MGLTCVRNTESAMRYWANIWITELKHWCDFFHTLSSFVAASKKRFGNEKWQPMCNSSCLCVAAHAYMMSLHGERERVRWWSKSLLSLSQLTENNLIFRVLATLEVHRKGWRAVCYSRTLFFCFSYFEMNALLEERCDWAVGYARASHIRKRSIKFTSGLLCVEMCKRFRI